VRLKIILELQGFEILISHGPFIRKLFENFFMCKGRRNKGGERQGEGDPLSSDLRRFMGYASMMA
jgi:hypothetical protein